MKFEEKIVKLRKSKGLSQEELAEKLGVSRQAVSRWELGSTTPDLTNLKQLSEVFGVSADYLIHDDYESDEDIPKVKETSKIICEKDERQSKAYLSATYLWIFAAITWGVAACISYSYNVGVVVVYIMCAFFDVFLAISNYCKYRRIMVNVQK